VYVPVPGAPDGAIIAPGSGIVGTVLDPIDGDPNGARLRIDYEGDIHGLTPASTFADRVERATGRHRWNAGLGYPTVARSVVPPDAMASVGTFDPDTGEVTLTNSGLLLRWLEVAELDPAQLASTDLRHERRRQWRAAASSPDPRLREMARREARRLGLDPVTGARPAR
jgi:hypothetical protein